jgi:hypothetical protein
VLLDAAAATLYFAAGVTYEIAIPLVLIASVAYALLFGIPAAVRRAPADWLAAGLAIAVIGPGAQDTRGGEFDPSHIVGRLHETWGAWLDVLEQSIPAHEVVLGLVGWLL